MRIVNAAVGEGSSEGRLGMKQRKRLLGSLGLLVQAVAVELRNKYFDVGNYITCLYILSGNYP